MLSLLRADWWNSARTGDRSTYWKVPFEWGPGQVLVDEDELDGASWLPAEDDEHLSESSPEYWRRHPMPLMLPLLPLWVPRTPLVASWKWPRAGASVEKVVGGRC